MSGVIRFVILHFAVSNDECFDRVKMAIKYQLFDNLFIFRIGL